jgi:hypothetical protein
LFHSESLIPKKENNWLFRTEKGFRG